MGIYTMGGTLYVSNTNIYSNSYYGLYVDFQTRVQISHTNITNHYYGGLYLFDVRYLDIEDSIISQSTNSYALTVDYVENVNIKNTIFENSRK
jgi:hypothetical protein